MRLNNLSVNPVFLENEDEENVREFPDGSEGGLTAEEKCPLPIEVFYVECQECGYSEWSQ